EAAANVQSFFNMAASMTRGCAACQAARAAIAEVSGGSRGPALIRLPFASKGRCRAVLSRGGLGRRTVGKCAEDGCPGSTLRRATTDHGGASAAVTGSRGFIFYASPARVVTIEPILS